jgi:flavin reductase (DIM6/NTAB) family NADH-FMN oxidoreductase RutF
MVPLDLRCNHVFYMCPRPVVLVTVEHEGAGNMFPMDLIGPTDSEWYSMALRKTSPAIRLMQESRRIALASVPVQQKAIAYEMGKHHGKANIDWASLPFRTVPSTLYGLPVLEGALCVRDVHIQEFHEVGSHILFITTIERETFPENPLEDGSPQLFHAFSSYRQYLAMQMEDTSV